MKKSAPSVLSAIEILTKDVARLRKDLESAPARKKIAPPVKPRGLRGAPIATPEEWKGKKKLCAGYCGKTKDVERDFGFKRGARGLPPRPHSYCTQCRSGYHLKPRVYKTKNNP